MRNCKYVSVRGSLSPELSIGVYKSGFLPSRYWPLDLLRIAYVISVSFTISHCKTTSVSGCRLPSLSSTVLKPGLRPSRSCLLDTLRIECNFGLHASGVIIHCRKVSVKGSLLPSLSKGSLIPGFRPSRYLPLERLRIAYLVFPGVSCWSETGRAGEGTLSSLLAPGTTCEEAIDYTHDHTESYNSWSISLSSIFLMLSEVIPMNIGFSAQSVTTMHIRLPPA